MTDRTVTYRLRAELGSFQASMAQASASTRKVAGDMTSLSKEGEKSRAGLASVGKVAGAMGLVAAAGLGAAVLKAAEFDKAMSNVQAATGETAGNMDRLREAALQAGADTAFSASEAADAIKELSFAGVSTEDILGGGLSGALDLAAAGSIEVGDAASFAASAMNQFKLSGSDIPHVADLLAGAASSASGEVSDYGAALNQAGLVSAQFGLTIEETMGTLAAMGSAGFIGSDAGTSLKTFLQALVPASDKAQTAMEEMGFSAFDAQGNFVGMTDVAKQLSDGLGDMSEQQRNATLKTIFGADAVRAAGLIYEQGGKGMQSWIDKTDQTGVAADQAATKMDNLAGDWEELTGSIETALIGTGEGAQGPLRSLVQGLTGVTNAYNKLPGSAQTATAAMLGGAAALGGSIWVGTKIISGIAATRLAIERLGLSATTTTRLTRAMGLAIKGLAIGGGVVAGLMIVTAAAEKIRAAFDEALPGVNQFTGALLDLTAGDAASIPDELDSIGDSVDRLTDKRWDVGASDSIWDAIGVEPDSLHDATREVESLDAALANIASTAGSDVAADALTQFAKAQGLSASQLARLKTLLPQYDEAVAGAANQSKIAATATDKLGGAASGAAGKMKGLANMTADEAKAMEEAHDKAVETGRAFFGLGEKVDKAKVSLGGWIRDMAKQAQALREFTHNAQVAAKRGLNEGLIASLEEAGPTGALRMRQLANASQSEIARANKAWRSGERAIDAHADAITHAQQVAQQGVHTRVEVDGVDAAIGALSSIRTGLINLDGTHAETWVTTRHVTVRGPGPVREATGGYISGPGTATSDSIPALLSNGEYVIKAAAVAKYGRHLFESLNAQRYANGGMVAPAASVSVASPRVSLTGTQITAVFPGVGEVVGQVVRTEIAADRTYHNRLDDRD